MIQVLQALRYVRIADMSADTSKNDKNSLVTIYLAMLIVGIVLFIVTDNAVFRALTGILGVLAIAGFISLLSKRSLS